MLAEVIKPRRNLNVIAKMKDKKGELKYSTRDISKKVLLYYQSLYKVNANQNCEDKQNGGNKIKQYLQKIKVISEEDSSNLKKYIFRDEIEQAIRQLGKVRLAKV